MDQMVFELHLYGSDGSRNSLRSYLISSGGGRGRREGLGVGDAPPYISTSITSLPSFQIFKNSILINFIRLKQHN